MLTRIGEMQKILVLFSLRIANDTPTDIVAGNAGGTVIVKRSSDLLIKASLLKPSLISTGKVLKNPVIPTNAIAATNVKESL